MSRVNQCQECELYTFIRCLHCLMTTLLVQLLPSIILNKTPLAATPPHPPSHSCFKTCHRIAAGHQIVQPCTCKVYKFPISALQHRDEINDTLINTASTRWVGQCNQTMLGFQILAHGDYFSLPPSRHIRSSHNAVHSY